MSDDTVKILDALSEKFGIAIDWTNENVMPYVMEAADHIVAYRLGAGIFAVSMLLAASAICVFIALKAFGHGRRNNWDSELDVLALVVAPIVFGLTFSMFCANALGVIKCLTAPELVLLDEIARLMR